MTDVILRISGLDCGACAVRIVRALRGLPGVHAVSVSDTAGCARLTYDEAAVGLGEIARCVQRAGFAVPVETAELRCPGADDGAEARLRAVFGVRSAARAGDTFMVTLWPVGTDAAALPAVLGPGAPGLLAALILFAYSAYAAFTGLRPCFPAPCGIVCALLAGKYAAQLVRGALHAPVRRLRHLRPRTATVVRDGMGTPVDADALTPRDVVRVLPGERVPVDGVVCSGTCTVDAFALTGAARPAEKAVGDTVLAGTLNRAAERGEMLTRGAEASAARTARTVRRGIWLLLAYHAVCLPLAACGVIGPGAAAVLACGASGGVLLCALRGNETKGERP